jgi:hypothetical protein
VTQGMGSATFQTEVLALVPNEPAAYRRAHNVSRRSTNAEWRRGLGNVVVWSWRCGELFFPRDETWAGFGMFGAPRVEAGSLRESWSTCSQETM